MAILVTPARRRGLAAALLVVSAVYGPTVGVGAVSDQKPTKALVLSAQLRAEGTGAIEIQGSIVAFGEVRGAATLVVTDASGNTRVTVGSKLEKLKRRARKTFAVPAGSRLYVESTNATLRLISPQGLKVSAAAKGNGRFEGTGTYNLNGGQNVSWGGSGLRISLLPPGAAKATVTRPPATPPQPPATTLQSPPATTATTSTTSTVATQPQEPPSTTLVTTPPPKGG